MKVALLCYVLDVRLDLSFRTKSKQPTHSSRHQRYDLQNPLKEIVGYSDVVGADPTFRSHPS